MRFQRSLDPNNNQLTTSQRLQACFCLGQGSIPAEKVPGHFFLFSGFFHYLEFGIKERNVTSKLSRGKGHFHNTEIWGCIILK